MTYLEILEAFRAKNNTQGIEEIVVETYMDEDTGEVITVERTIIKLAPVERAMLERRRLDATALRSHREIIHSEIQEALNQNRSRYNHLRTELVYTNNDLAATRSEMEQDATDDDTQNGYGGRLNELNDLKEQLSAEIQTLEENYPALDAEDNRTGELLEVAKAQENNLNYILNHL